MSTTTSQSSGFIAATNGVGHKALRNNLSAPNWIASPPVSAMGAHLLCSQLEPGEEKKPCMAACTAVLVHAAGGQDSCGDSGTGLGPTDAGEQVPRGSSRLQNCPSGPDFINGQPILAAHPQFSEATQPDAFFPAKPSACQRNL